MMRLRHRVRLQRNTPTQDATGQPVESWATYRECWGAVVDGGGSQGGIGEQQQGTTDTEVSIRFPAEDSTIPDPLDRVSYTEVKGRVRTLNIDAVQRVDSTRRMLTLKCSEVADG